MFSVVNRRPDDECQSACGVYRSVDEGQQLQVMKTAAAGDWDLVIPVAGGDCDSLTLMLIVSLYLIEYRLGCCCVVYCLCCIVFYVFSVIWRAAFIQYFSFCPPYFMKSHPHHQNGMKLGDFYGIWNEQIKKILRA